MKVNIKHEEPMRVYFEDVKEGVIFLRKNGEVWMKVPLVAVEADDNADYYNALNMETSEFDGLNACETVILPKVAELNIEY
jgi:hypothetical protein